MYSCVLVDFKSCQLFDLLPGKHNADLYSYFSSISEETRDRVEYICIDMWETYRDAAHVFFSVRISVMNSFAKGSDEYYLLKKYHWLLSSRQSAVTAGRDIYLGRNASYRCRGYIRLRDLLNIMLDISSELETAYVIKEGYLELNACSTAENTAARMESWLNYIERSGSPEFISTAANVRKWKQEILNSINTFEGRRISNGPVESANSRVKKIKSSANGYTVFERFRMQALCSLNQDSVIKF